MDWSDANGDSSNHKNPTNDVNSIANGSVDVILRSVDLGFVNDDTEGADLSHLKTHHFFPVGKIGGKPAWLSLNPLPMPENVQCKVCGETMAFLVQIYAPVEGGREDCFHRTVFVFVCRNPACCRPNSADNIAVLRSQLPRNNPYYGYDPLDPQKDKSLEGCAKAEDYGSLCVVCGCSGGKKCARCEKAWYCSKAHQSRHWKGGHKNECVSGLERVGPFEDKTFLFPELELILEPEELEEEEEEKERPESERMEEYTNFLEKHKDSMATAVGKEECLNEGDFEHTFSKTFKLFHKIVRMNPEQVLRYQRGGTPLWAADEIPDAQDIPRCGNCGEERVFEFQIMPSLLSHMDVDSLCQSIDWATVVVYTCRNSCTIADNGYFQEFALKQDFSE